MSQGLRTLAHLYVGFWKILVIDSSSMLSPTPPWGNNGGNKEEPT